MNERLAGIMDVMDALMLVSHTMTEVEVTIADLVQVLPCVLEEGWERLETQIAMLSTAIQIIMNEK